MMEAGWAFDDDIFAEPKDTSKSQPLVSYNAKFCTDEWFSSAENLDSTEQMNVYKYRGDHAYSQHQYTAALHHYQSCQAVLPANNVSVWRDVQEGRTRCYLALHQPQPALHLALELQAKGSNFEQRTSLFCLLVHVYKQLGQLQEWLSAAQMLVTLHPTNPDLWLQLAQVYKERLSRNVQGEYTCSEQTPQTAGVQQAACRDTGSLVNDTGVDHCHGDQNSVGPITDQCGQLDIADASSVEQLGVCTSGMDLQLVVATCLLRARLLLQSVQETVQSFAKVRNCTLQQQVSSEIDALQISEADSTCCMQFLVQDLHKPVKDSSSDAEDVVSTESTPMVCITETPDEDISIKDFEKTWFSWRT